MGRLTGYSRDGLTFQVSDTGPLGGEPVLLLHGFPQDRTAWDRVGALLHADGLRTLAPDLRGYSAGARPRGRAAYRLGAIVDDCLALLDAAGLDRVHLAGHDWGGGLAWALAGRHADRVRSVTVLSTPHPAAMSRAMLRSTQVLQSWYMAFFQLPWLPEQLVGASVERLLRSSGLPAAQAGHYAARMREPGALSAALAWYRALPWSLQDPVPRCPVPTTYVWGRHDVALGRAAAEATARMVSGDYRFVELDAGHWLPETRAEEVARHLTERVRVGSG